MGHKVNLRIDACINFQAWSGMVIRRLLDLAGVTKGHICIYFFTAVQKDMVCNEKPELKSQLVFFRLCLRF